MKNTSNPPKGKVSIKSAKRLLIVFAVIAALMTGLLFRTAWIQVIHGEDYSDIAKDQQTSDIPIEAKRGSIYDRNGEELATSATCYTVWVRPSQVRENYGESKRAELANELAVIIGMDAADVSTKFESENVLIKVARYLEREQADQVRTLGISGIEIAEDTKRYYPMGDFASVLLGSVNDEGVGRSGIELRYDEYLSGVAGRSVMNTDVNGNSLARGNDKYYEASDGLNIVTTIDKILQMALENAVRKGLTDTESTRVMAMAMNPETGEILAMSVTPSFDPNNATVPTGDAQLEAFSAMSSEEQTEYLSVMWRNQFISDVYEPGSTMKLITSSSALEEGIATPETWFYCPGYYEVAGLKIFDAEKKSHGNETLLQAVGNSCNPVHMQLALTLGMDKFYKHLELYGLTEKTGVDYPAESPSIVSDPDTIGPVELAEMGFGQAIAITPMQLITAASAIANDGVMMQPHFVKELTDKDGNIVVTYAPKIKRKVISKETADEMLDIMYNQVENYGGRTARIQGYRIGGKTGTSSKVDPNTGTYGTDTDTSFICVAPADDPKILILVVCQSPQKTYYADLTAIPIAKSFMTKALSYLNIAPEAGSDTSHGPENSYAYVPDITNISYSEAAEILKGYELKYEVVPALTEEEKSDRDFTFTVVDQYPKAGARINKSETVYIYRE